jgi:hypothetical protein
MSALIRGFFHLDPKGLTEDEFFEMWGQAKYYLEVVHQVEFS